MKVDKDKRRGIIGTVMVHVLLLIFLLVVALRTPLPLPGEEGVEVNLGYDDQGKGDVQSDTPPPMQEPVPVVKKVVQPPAEPEPEPVEEDVITQDIEEAPAIEEEIVEPEPEKEEEVIEEEEPKPIPEQVIEEEPTEEVIDSVFVVDELVEEVPVEEPKPVVNKRALYTGSSATSDTQGTSQGITEGAGDQGKPHGYEEVDDYTGRGGSGNGPQADLGGRGSLFLETPSAKFNEQGTVVISIWVDRDGIVKKAQVSAKGTTILDQNLRKIALDAANNSTFVKDNNAVELQRGIIKYNFVLMK